MSNEYDLAHLVAIGAKAVADHHAHHLDMPEGDPNGPMDEDYEVAQAVVVAILEEMRQHPVSLDNGDT